MMEQVEINNAAKEVLYLCEYFDPEINMKIPENFLLKLKELASTSNIIVSIDYKKKLTEQKISETAKDILALIYYSYIAEPEEKSKIKEIWDKNDAEHKAYIKEKYDPKRIFKEQAKVEEKNNEVIVYNQSFISKIIEKIKRIFKQK